MNRIAEDARAAHPVATLARAACRAVMAAAHAWLRFWRTRTAMRQLSEMTETQLADIGLTRCDLDRVTLRAPRGRATEVLEGIARQRRVIDRADGRPRGPCCVEARPVKTNPMQA